MSKARTYEEKLRELTHAANVFHSQGKYVQELSVRQGIQRLIAEEKARKIKVMQEERITLYEKLRNDDERNQVTMEIIALSVLADITWGRAMDLEQRLKKLGIEDANIVYLIKDGSKTLGKACSIIDEPEREDLSDGYANITEDLDEWLKRYLLPKVDKLMNKYL